MKEHYYLLEKFIKSLLIGMRSKIIDIIITVPFTNRLHFAYHKESCITRSTCGSTAFERDTVTEPGNRNLTAELGNVILEVS